MEHPWRVRLAGWFLPLARRCPLSPNQITLIALVANLGAAAVLSFGSKAPECFLIAPAIATLGGLLDAFDGLVARERHLESQLGDFLDHLLDRISDSCLIAGWAIGTGVRIHLALLAVLAVTLTGYAGTQIEATFRHRSYGGLGRGEFVLALVAMPIFAYSLASAGILGTRFWLLSIPEWLTLCLTAFAILGIVQRLRLAFRLASGAGDGEPGNQRETE